MQPSEEIQSYNTIDRSGTAEYKDRGSRFIAYACPVNSKEEFSTRLKQLKKDHPKAVHLCFAYKIGLTSDNYRASDDGEPSGSAGKPILGQIESRGLTNVAIIIVRYFGGTLLGVPGLINAYKTAASLVLQTIPSVNKPVEVLYQLNFDYQEINEIMRIIKKFKGNIVNQELSLFPELTLAIPKSIDNEFFKQINELHNVKLKKLV